MEGIKEKLIPFQDGVFKQDVTIRTGQCSDGVVLIINSYADTYCIDNEFEVV